MTTSTKIDYLIISDLNGWKEFSLESEKKIVRLDAREIGGIKSFENVHQQFIDGGIVHAAKHLMEYDVDTVIGLSIGGLIAWRALLNGWKVKKLIAISSTRLRFETKNPSVETMLYFGALDPFIPDSKWFSRMKVPYKIISGEKHDLYKRADLKNL